MIEKKCVLCKEEWKEETKETAILVSHGICGRCSDIYKDYTEGRIDIKEANHFAAKARAETPYRPLRLVR
jgi:hypothetical protein